MVVFDRPRVIDRIVVREDQMHGQTIRAWDVEAQLLSASGETSWSRIANGTSMGNKWIVLLEKNVTATASECACAHACNF